MKTILHKALALLPLLLMGAGVWYYVQSRLPHGRGETGSAADAGAFSGGREETAAPASGGDGAAAARIPEAYDPRAGVEIQGSERFKGQVTSALKLVWLADRGAFFFLKNSLYVIRNEDKTGFYMENGRPVAAVSSDHAFRSLTWCAGIVAHQAWHAAYEQKKRGKKARPAPPPPGGAAAIAAEANPMSVEYKGMDAILYVEDQAMAYQLEILGKVGAPARETRPLFRRAPRDFHLGHDGNYVIAP